MQLEPFVLQEKTLGALLDETIARYPDTDAVVQYERPVRQTWKEFGQCVDRLAKGLMALGIAKGDKIAIWATNVPHWVTLMFASARIGAILITVNTSYKAGELEYLLRQSDCENLFMTDAYRDHNFIDILFSVIPEAASQPTTDLTIEKLPHLKRIFLMGNKGQRGLGCIEDVFALADTVTDEAYEARKAEINPYDVVNMQYTSGTTGFPKGVMLTHETSSTTAGG